MRIIHHLDELLAALALGEREMLTPDNALGYLGAGYVAAMIAEAKKEYPDFILWCDAGQDAAAIMAALRMNVHHLTIETDMAVLCKLQEMAVQVGAIVKNRTVVVAEYVPTKCGGA